jgi:hypothetical protein
MKVHPFADRWPMLPEEELADLAADIKNNGLRYPIVLAKTNGEDMIIDGRNRLRACQIAGVKPDFERLDGEDPVAFIISSNAARRQMTKGALAMVLATQYPEPEEVGRGKKGFVAKQFPMVTKSKLSIARAVIAYAPELVEAVIHGGKSLDSAYEIAVDRKNGAASDEQKMERLRREAPDLAELVVEERMTAGEAIAALNKRIEDHENEQRTATFLLHQTLSGINPRTKPPDEWADEMLELIDERHWPNKATADLSVECLKACAAALNIFVQKWEEQYGKQRKEK